MRILITGGGGTLGRALVPQLVARGDDPVVFDLQPPDVPGATAIRGDVTRRHDVQAAMEGADAVVHTAAIHGIHLANHSADDFFELNVRGTFNVWQAASAAHVKGFVFSSTMGVYGESRRPKSDSDVVAVTEDMPLKPGDIYGYSKLVGEEMCRFHLRANGIPSIALRFGMFVPEPFFRYGIRLLYGGVHESDVARSVVHSIDALIDGRIEHEAFNVESRLPFKPADVAELRRDPVSVIDGHYPGSRDLLRSRGVTTLNPITEWFRMDRAEERLGFRPQHNFGEWLEELARRPEDHADKNPPWP
jgi:nucleoside-diphosphate-sugar epimerase